MPRPSCRGRPFGSTIMSSGLIPASGWAHLHLMGYAKSRITKSMAAKKLFLSHFNGDAAEARGLAAQLRLHGITPWVDKDGGFQIGDHSPSEARRAIREDCFGLLLYATEAAFHREFIRDVEIDEARKVRELDPHFLLFAVPRRMDFECLAQRSQEAFGYDLSAFHTVALPEGCDLNASFRRVAMVVLDRVLRRASASDGRASISMQFSTRELLPDEPDDILRIDATRRRDAPDQDERAGEQLLVALKDVKSKVAEVFGRPRVMVHGSKHLSAAFTFGRIFALFHIDIRQTAHEVWSTHGQHPSRCPLAVSREEGSGHRRLFVEVASRLKNVGAGVDHFIRRTGIEPSMRLQVWPAGEPLDLDNALCLAMVHQVYAEIERAMRDHPAHELHIFPAAPQAFMMMLGREFKGMPPTCVYDWTGTQYELGCRVPGGVL